MFKSNFSTTVYINIEQQLFVEIKVQFTQHI